MRYFAILFTTLGLAACSTAPVTRRESQAVSPTQVLAPEVVQFLLTAAASDFRTHRPPDPVRFRDVRVGHVVTPSGKEQYMLCGQLLPAQEGGKARSEEHTSELQSHHDLVCRLLLEKKQNTITSCSTHT